MPRAKKARIVSLTCKLHGAAGVPVRWEGNNWVNVFADNVPRLCPVAGCKHDLEVETD